MSIEWLHMGHFAMQAVHSNVRHWAWRLHAGNVNMSYVMSYVHCFFALWFSLFNLFLAKIHKILLCF